MSEKNKGGRPPYQPTDKERAQVKLLAGMGVGTHDIAKVIGMSHPTLHKHFWQELELGHIEANANVAKSLYKQATSETKPNVTAAIFWLKCRAGWREDAEVSKRERVEEAARTAASGTSWQSLLDEAAATRQ